MAEFTPPILELPEIYEPTRIDIERYLNNIPSPALDIGGPSFSPGDRSGFAAFHALDGIALRHQLISANIKRDAGVGLLADAENLPFADGGVAFLLSAYLPTFKPGEDPERNTLWRRFMSDAQRSLKAGGVLVMEGLDDNDIGYAQMLGMRVLRLVRSHETLFGETISRLSFLGHVIFVKD